MRRLRRPPACNRRIQAPSRPNRSAGVVNELTWNTFRDHAILEYEVPKYDGDLGQPNVFVPLAQDVCLRKAELLLEHFGSQRDRHWFTTDLFLSLLRFRGVECASSTGYAEAYHGRKVVITA